MLENSSSAGLNTEGSSGPLNILHHVFDFVAVLLFCAVFLLLKELKLIGFEQYSENWVELISALLPVIGFSTLFSYVPFLVGCRIKKSPSTFAILSVISTILFFLFSSILGVIIFRASGYYEVLGDASDFSATDQIYVWLTPVTCLTFVSLLYAIFKGIFREKSERTERASLYEVAVPFFDFVLVFLFCYIFVLVGQIVPDLYKTFLYEEYKGLYIRDYSKFFSVGVLVAIGSFITVYPPFLIGYRVLKSPKWFCILSWLSYVLFVLIFSSIIFDYPAYVLINPRLLMALFATALLFKETQPHFNGEKNV